MTVYEAAADKWLEKSWDGYSVIDNIEHFINVEVLNDLLVIEYSEMEDPIINIAERKYVSILALINDVSFDIVSINDHSLNRFNLLHHDKIIVLYMVYLILFFAQDDCLVLLVHDSNGHYHVVVSLY